MDDEAPFRRPSNAGRGGCRGARKLPRGGKAVQHRREQCGAVDAAVSSSVAARPSRLKDERDWLLARVAASPDLPLHDLRRELAARNVPVGYGTI